MNTGERIVKKVNTYHSFPQQVKLKDKILKEGQWQATMWMDSREAATLMRESLEELGYVFQRDATYKPFTKFMILIPLPQFSYVFQFLVKEPKRFLINIFDTKPTHSGTLHHIEIKGIEEENLLQINKLLKLFSRKMGLEPYKFPVYQRLQMGLLKKEFFSSKRLWSLWGI